MMLVCIVLESEIFGQISEKLFAKDEKTALLRRLSFGMGSLAKDCFQPLVTKISIKTLEK